MLSKPCYISRNLPSFCSTLIPICIILLFLNSGVAFEGYFIVFSILLVLFWFILSTMFFPKIIITIKGNDEEESNLITLYADGRVIYRTCKILQDDWPPVQFGVQVWRSSKHKILLIPNKSAPRIKEANTYDHSVCQIEFDLKEKQKIDKA